MHFIISDENKQKKFREDDIPAKLCYYIARI